MTHEDKQLVHMLLSDENARQPEFYLEHFTAKQRKELIKTLNQTLWDENIMLYTAIKIILVGKDKEQS